MVRGEGTGVRRIGDKLWRGELGRKVVELAGITFSVWSQPKEGQAAVGNP